MLGRWLEDEAGYEGCDIITAYILFMKLGQCCDSAVVVLHHLWEEEGKRAEVDLTREEQRREIGHELKSADDTIHAVLYCEIMNCPKIISIIATENEGRFATIYGIKNYTIALNCE